MNARAKQTDRQTGVNNLPRIEHMPYPYRNSLKSIRKFVSNPTDRQTDRQTDRWMTEYTK